MTLSRYDQIQFAREILALVGDDESIDIDALRHVENLTSLLLTWIGADNGVAVALNEYVGELTAVKQTSGDVGWKDDFKESLLRELGVTD